jgi:hypothetical protein
MHFYTLVLFLTTLVACVAGSAQAGPKGGWVTRPTTQDASTDSPRGGWVTKPEKRDAALDGPHVGWDDGHGNLVASEDAPKGPWITGWGKRHADPQDAAADTMKFVKNIKGDDMSVDVGRRYMIFKKTGDKNTGTVDTGIVTRSDCTALCHGQYGVCVSDANGDLAAFKNWYVLHLLLPENSILNI